MPQIYIIHKANEVDLAKAILSSLKIGVTSQSSLLNQLLSVGVRKVDIFSVTFHAMHYQKLDSRQTRIYTTSDALQRYGSQLTRLCCYCTFYDHPLLKIII